ncbi:hypothetical protein C8C96_4160 [Acidovorax sp. 100]|uniref:hypothetical protein n=1 Tax=Acidovorax sp. 100 TaxID=2135635 RepID=UPI000F16400F|nr:hypothetical protein [Acidovorax sp. 100]RMA63083.1 hypothetical protein C8C96_4160 [Acidovorax sp. 100]
MSLLHLPEAAIGSIAAAVIGAFFAFIGLVIAKESKVSEFRQAWIDELRTEIALVIAALNNLRGISVVQIPSQLEAFKLTESFFMEANKASSAIKLRLNPNEERCKEVLRLLNNLESLHMKGFPIDIQACRKCEDDLLAASQLLLKAEWRRVRTGERVFNVAKWSGLAVSIALVVLLLFSVANSSGKKAAVNDPVDAKAPLLGASVPLSSTARSVAPEAAKQ